MASRVFKNVAIGSAVGVGGLYLWDQSFNHRALSRTGFALYNAALVGIDYKWNFKDGKDIEGLHERNALRLYNVIRHNKGLYVKVGQSVAIQGSMLPAPYRTLLSNLFDGAPQDTWEECLETLKGELGRDPSEVFAYIDHNAVASASIAQVHRAKLHSGEDVAVKIQHADIPKSTFWDLSTYKALVWIYDKYIFKMPMYFVGKYIADQVQEETDFKIELKNAQTMARLVDSDPDTKGVVYVPKVYPALSSSRVLVMEWIEGASMNNRDAVERGKYDIKKALTGVFKILTKEAFEWGVVHSDPHPGNWILRFDPRNKNRQQLVMLDHGLYVYMSDTLREQYAQLWKAMFRRDMAEITRITAEWGFGEPKLFASATMLQPYDEEISDFAKQDFTSEKEKAERFRNFLKNTEKIPLELVFVGRTQRILQGLNQMYGSPVNRMRILVDESLKVSSAHPETRDKWRFPLVYRLSDWLHRRLLLLVADLTFVFYQVKQKFTNQDPESAFDKSIQQNSARFFKD